MNQAIKTILFFFLIGILWLPVFQESTGYFNETKLNGAYVDPAKPVFSWDSWTALDFQKKFEDFKNHHFGFRGFLVKMKNSMEYFLFGKINATDIIEGKKGYLFSYGSVNRYYGNLYNGEEKNSKTLEKIKFMKEGIEKKGKHFLCIIAPPKESVVPELLGDEYASMADKKTDCDDFIQGYRENNIPFIDFCSYFKAIKDTSSYPLFTKTGFHWSVYGASLAHDSLLKYIENLFGKDLPGYSRTGIEISDTARDSEADFEEPMNLLFKISDLRYYYPKFEMTTPSEGNFRPRVIIIGDSFFWQIKNLRLMMHVFSEDSRYWYYFSKSFPLSDLAGSEMKDVDVMKEIESADLVILFSNISTMDDFPFGVADYYHENYEKK